jgi:hypothetical protein
LDCLSDELLELRPSTFAPVGTGFGDAEVSLREDRLSAPIPYSRDVNLSSSGVFLYSLESKKFDILKTNLKKKKR